MNTVRMTLPMALHLLPLDLTTIIAGYENPAPALTFACAGGNLELAQWLVEVFGAPAVATVVRAFERACANGRLSVAQWLTAFGALPSSAACTAASGSGHLKTLKWLANWIDPSVSDANVACENGHTKVARWLVARAGFDRGRARKSFRRACARGFLEAAELLLELGTCPGTGCTLNVLHDACVGGRPDVIDWVSKRLGRGDAADPLWLSNYTFMAACRPGNLEIVQWLVGQRTRIGMSALPVEDFRPIVGAAVAARDRPLVFWLLMALAVAGCVPPAPASDAWMRVACATGDLPLAELIHNARDNPIMSAGAISKCLASAGKHGHAHMVRWAFRTLRAHSPVQPFAAFRAACRGGHTATAKWLAGNARITRAAVMGA